VYSLTAATIATMSTRCELYFVLCRFSIQCRFPHFPVPHFPPIAYWIAGPAFFALAVWCSIFQCCILLSRIVLSPVPFLRSETVTYTIKVVTSRKQCKIDTWILQSTSRKWRMGYWIAPFPVTLSYLEGHSPIARFSKCDSSYSCLVADKIPTDLEHRAVPSR